jgi:hypothetical protein
MKVALGFKPHSGWAALLVLGKQDDEYIALSRSRVELVTEAWAKQPYHAAEELEPKEALAVVKRGVEAAHRIALQELRAALKRQLNQGHQVRGCGVVVGNPMPKWKVAEILAVHFRMHQAEGVLFREALINAAEKCSLPVVALSEKVLLNDAATALKTSTDKLQKRLLAMGKIAGAPWGKDQKDAALVAMVALDS